MKTNNSIITTSIFIILLNMTILRAFSQESAITWSPEFVEGKGDRMGQILHDNGDASYVFAYNLTRKDKITPGIIKFNSSMQPVQRKDYNANVDQDTEMFLIGLFYCGGKFIMLTNTNNNKSKSMKVYATFIDQNTLDPISEAKEIMSIEDIYIDYKLKLRYVISPDSLSFGVLGITYEAKKMSMPTFKEPQKIIFKVFDSHLNTINERNMELECLLFKYNVVDYELDNQGTIVVISQEYIEAPTSSYRNSKNGKIPNFDIFISSYSPEKANTKHKIALGSYFLNSISLELIPESENMIVFSTWRDEYDKSRIMECNFLILNKKSCAIITQKKIEISKELIAEVNKKDDAGTAEFKRDIYLHSTFRVSELKATADGRIYVLLEQNFTDSPKIFSYGIITFLFDTTGEQKWAKYLAKKQVFVNNDLYMYTSSIIKDDKIIILYNEHDKINENDPVLTDKKPRVFDSWTSSVLMQTELFNDGKMERKTLASSKVMGTPISIGRSKQGADNRYFLYGWQIKEDIYKIGLVNIQ
ncbi:MAG: hypothetical protein M3Q95_11205 [Bacteroidota bacterium]|nr:hypothetical protein [Bacteroidota bacterium]